MGGVRTDRRESSRPLCHGHVLVNLTRTLVTIDPFKQLTLSWGSNVTYAVTQLSTTIHRKWLTLFTVREISRLQPCRLRQGARMSPNQNPGDIDRVDSLGSISSAARAGIGVGVAIVVCCSLLGLGSSSEGCVLESSLLRSNTTILDPRRYLPESRSSTGGAR